MPVLDFEKIEGASNTPSISNTCCITDKSNAYQNYNYIPIDFIKGQIIGLRFEYFIDVENDNQFVFDRSKVFTKKNNGNDIEHVYLTIENMTLRIYVSGRITICGSLHKLFNAGNHNHNDFNQKAFNYSIKRLFQLFRIAPEHLRLIVLEFGVNLLPPIETNLILNNTLMHRGVEFVTSIANKKGRFIEAIHACYRLKVYNKAMQYGLPFELLRIEIKQTNWSKYRKQGIETLQDFINTPKDLFVNELVNQWQCVVFYNPFHDSERWIRYSNLNFWRDLLHKSGTTNKKHRDRLKELNSQCIIDVQSEVTRLILDKIDSKQGVTNFRLSESKPKRRCLLTGIDISSQKANSFLLSHTGLKKLYHSDSKEFNRIKCVVLPKSWQFENIDIQIKEIAHQIRNRYNYQQKTKVGQLSLFRVGV